MCYVLSPCLRQAVGTPMGTYCASILCSISCTHRVTLVANPLKRRSERGRHCDYDMPNHPVVICETDIPLDSSLLFLYSALLIVICLSVLFFLAIVLPVLLRFTASD
jgi:hypothetical protein